MALDPIQEEQFERALKFVLSWEGGYGDDPDDHGGRTNFGITESEYNAWKHAQGQTGHFPVLGITTGEVRQIYLEEYWLKAHCGRLAWPACAALFDSVVNCGQAQGVKFLQRAVGVHADGSAGPATWKGALSADPKRLCRGIADHRAQFYDSLVKGNPSQIRFIRGWLNRAKALRALGDS